MRKSIMHVGMDVHKDSIEIAIAEDGGNQEVRALRTHRWRAWLAGPSGRKLVSTGKPLRFYLARLERGGELTAVYVPGEEDEAMRDLSRAREDAKRVETRARQQLLALLLRNGIKYGGRLPGVISAGSQR